jgi:hypothetical protein
MTIAQYSDVRTELNSFTDRAYSQAQVDTFLQLFEADVRTWLGGAYRRATSITVTTDADGLGSLPSGFIRPIALKYSTYGNLQLVTWDALTDYNPDDSGGVPEVWAILGTQFKVAPVIAGSFTLDYEGTLTGLGTNNATNWLLTAAPQAYFWGVYSQAEAYEKKFDVAAGAEAKAKSAIAALGMQMMAGQFGRASLRLRAAP